MDCRWYRTSSSEGSFPKAGSHMFVSSKPSWFQIADDGIRQCEGFDEAFVEAWPKTVSGWKAAGMKLTSGCFGGRACVNTTNFISHIC